MRTSSSSYDEVSSRDVQRGGGGGQLEQFAPRIKEYNTGTFLLFLKGGKGPKRNVCPTPRKISEWPWCHLPKHDKLFFFFTLIRISTSIVVVSKLLPTLNTVVF